LLFRQDKYTQVQAIVFQLTEDPTFRTFFTLYLMAESDTERETINQRFWDQASTLDSTDQMLLRETLKQTFLKLPVLIANLRERVVLANA
jgi:hypothetical protein